MRGVSSVIAVLLLVLIAVAGAILVYLWYLPEIGKAERSTSFNEGMLKIEAVNPRPTGLEVYVRNVGDVSVELGSNSLLILDNGVVKAQGISAMGNVTLQPKQVVSIFYFLDRPLESGTYLAKVTSKEGVSASFAFKVSESIISASQVHTDTTANTVGNEVVSEDAYARYVSWVEEVSGYYRVYFRIYAKPGVTINYAYAELFDNTGEHPDWVGNNPWEWTTPYTYPDWAGAWWYPVRDDEMPVTIVFRIIPG